MRLSRLAISIGTCRLPLGLITCAMSALAQTPPTSGCQPQWVDGFAGTAGASNNVNCLSLFDDGTGTALYVGGNFDHVGGALINHIARWNGSAWSALGTGITMGDVYAIEGADLGTGSCLYAAGNFYNAGGTLVNHIARWNGTSWAGLGLGVYTPLQHPWVFGLETFDDGSGPGLYVVGDFTWAGNVQTPCVAKWDGSVWSGLGSGLTGGVSPRASTCKVFDDGSGAQLYVGGNFTTAGGNPISYIARWDGTAWSSFGAPLDGAVRALNVIDDGSGPSLYATGEFMSAGGVALNHIGKWDGTAWQPIGSGFPLGAWVAAPTWYDDGSGPALYASCGGATFGGTPYSGVVRWDGNTWSPVGGPTSGAGAVAALAGFTSGIDRGLYAGGLFYTIASVPSQNIAKWGYAAGCGQPGVEICAPGVAGVIACPCGNPPVGVGLGCDNSSSTGGAHLAATGEARVGYDSLLLSTSGERPTATSIVLQGSGVLTSGAVFGQGVRCVAGSLKRMYVKTAVGGSISAPEPGDDLIAARSATLGDTIVPGTHRYYGVYYRDPIVLGGCPATSGFNITQQLDVLWHP